MFSLESSLRRRDSRNVHGYWFPESGFPGRERVGVRPKSFRRSFFSGKLHRPEFMIPSKVCDGQGELEVLGLDVDVDVAHHVDQELDSLLRQRHELARRLLLQQRVECYKQADGQDFPNQPNVKVLNATI